MFHPELFLNSPAGHVPHPSFPKFFLLPLSLSRIFTCFSPRLLWQAVEGLLEGDEIRTDLAGIEEEIHLRGTDNVVCVVTTTSCFAPRAADSVEQVAKLCQRLGVGHIINNAYGVQVGRQADS